MSNTDTESLSLQDRYAPQNKCFGCGPMNDQGLRIKSFPRGDEVVCEFVPSPHHQAFQGVLNGGIVGALLDCHSNWTAIHAIMQRDHLDAAPAMVTADFHVTLKRPTALESKLTIRAKPVDVQADGVVVEATIEANGKITSTCRGTFVAVKPGHPAYHRW
ncbi:MAG: PaaI family thioesterase [Deltaproteobacteria bacterium]|nr:PaaI family thioesterase [Deltaproteobacteria bacterium]